MLWLSILLLVGLFRDTTSDEAAEQLPLLKKETQEPIGHLTTSYGVVIDESDIESLNSDLLYNTFFMEQITHLTREKIPERFVHPKAAGGLGYFEVTHDISHICKAKFLNGIGKRTPVTARLSLTFAGKGGPDTTRELRGFGVKFYTEEGNYDFLGLNIEMFIVKDPVFFPSFIHSFSNNPSTNMFDVNSRWDISTLHPECLSAQLFIYGDRGIPYNYRHLSGHAIHTFEVENVHGNTSYIRIHVLPDAGIKGLPSEEAVIVGGKDPDYATRDLYNSIARGDYPTWTYGIQVMTQEDIKAAEFDPFDVTFYWPKDKYPIMPVGKIVLNKNPENYFAQIEQTAFNPGNLVPGIRGVDKTFEARTLAYRDAHYHRLGANFNRIETNRPLTATRNYQRGGVSPVGDDSKGFPNFFPNSFNGPTPRKNTTKSGLFRVRYTNPEVNNFGQGAQLYSEIMSEGERVRLVGNIVSALINATSFLQDRAVKLYYQIHKDLGSRVKYGLMQYKV